MTVIAPPATEEEIVEFVRASTLAARKELASETAIAKHFEKLKKTLEGDNVPDDLLTETIHKALEEKPKKKP